MRTCQWCGQQVLEKAWCPYCQESFTSRPIPHTMTADEREAELRQLGESLEIPFARVHERIEQLLGRPVWTHEFGLNWEGLCREVRWEGRPPTLDEIIDLIPAEKRIVVEIPDE
jgi:hypothetical protein